MSRPWLQAYTKRSSGIQLGLALPKRTSRFGHGQHAKLNASSSRVITWSPSFEQEDSPRNPLVAPNSFSSVTWTPSPGPTTAPDSVVWTPDTVEWSVDDHTLSPTHFSPRKKKICQPKKIIDLPGNKGDRSRSTATIESDCTVGVYGLDVQEPAKKEESISESTTKGEKYPCLTLSIILCCFHHDN